MKSKTPYCPLVIGNKEEMAKWDQFFAGMENTPAERAEARAEAEGQELTAELLKPKADISTKAGKMERDSPLFYGKGDNPLLFNE